MSRIPSSTAPGRAAAWPSLAAVARLAWFAALLPMTWPSPSIAGIRPDVRDGEVVFTSRPRQKPADGPSSVQTPTRGRTAAPRQIAGLVGEIARRHDMDPALIATVIAVESGFDRMAVSPKGARGLMQLMPATAREYGVSDVHDPRQNLEGGVAYLRDLTRRYDGNLRLALAAYNAGPEAVERASGVPNFRETLEYLQKIESRYGRLVGDKAVASSRPKYGTGRIRATRDASGSLVATNRDGDGVRTMPSGRRGQ